MSLDQRLVALLDEAADEALPATRSGVQSAIDRRGRRRRRQRVAASGLALVAVLAGVGAAVVVSRHDTRSPLFLDAPTGHPLVGVDLPGWDLRLAGDSESVPGQDTDLLDDAMAVFSDPDDPLGGPVVFLTTTQDGLGGEGRPVDLDGDGDTAGEADGRIATEDSGGLTGIGLPVPGTATNAVISASGLDEDALVEYASALAMGPTFTVEEAPAPDGLPRRDVQPDGPQPGTSFAFYRGPRRAELAVTTNEGGVRAQLATIGVREDAEAVELGASLLGPGVAAVYDGEQDTGVVLTESGLSITLGGDGLDAAVIRRIIEEGRFLEVEPSVPSTTTVAPTTAIPTTSIGGDPTLLDPSIVDVRVGSHDGYDRVVIEFAERLPDTRDVVLADAPAAGECVVPDLPGTAFVNLHLGLTGTNQDPNDLLPYGTGDGPLLSVERTCEFEAFVDITIALDRPIEPVVTELTSPPRLVVDLPS